MKRVQIAEPLDYWLLGEQFKVRDPGFTIMYKAT